MKEGHSRGTATLTILAVWTAQGGVTAKMAVPRGCTSIHRFAAALRQTMIASCCGAAPYIPPRPCHSHAPIESNECLPLGRPRAEPAILRLRIRRREALGRRATY